MKPRYRHPDRSALVPAPRRAGALRPAAAARRSRRRQPQPRAAARPGDAGAQPRRAGAQDQARLPRLPRPRPACRRRRPAARELEETVRRDLEVSGYFEIQGPDALSAACRSPATCSRTSRPTARPATRCCCSATCGSKGDKLVFEGRVLDLGERPGGARQALQRPLLGQPADGPHLRRRGDPLPDRQAGDRPLRRSPSPPTAPAAKRSSSWTTTARTRGASPATARPRCPRPGARTAARSPTPPSSTARRASISPTWRAAASARSSPPARSTPARASRRTAAASPSPARSTATSRSSPPISAAAICAG